MLTQAEAIQRLKDTRRDYENSRRALQSFWTMAMSYDTGRQWTTQTTEFGRTILKHLPNIIDPGKIDVRVTMNVIHQHVNRIKAALSPERIASYCRPASGAIADQIAGDMGNRALARWLPRSDALSILREKDRTRVVLGTSVVRRCMTQTRTHAEPVVGRDNEGQPVKGKIADYRYYLSPVFPWEIIRDPSAVTAHPARDEEIVIQEQPRSIGWLQRNFGVSPETESTMGGMMDYRGQIYNAYGMAGQYVADSKVPGVLVYEAHYKDKTDGQSTDITSSHEAYWRHMLLGWADPGKDRDEIHPIYFGPNPFYGLPFHFWTYDEHVQAPWGIGVPHIAIAGQDITNLAWTWLFRTMQAGSGKWVVREGTVEKPNRMLSNRIDQPIIWHGTQNNPNWNVPPSIVSPPPINPVATDALIATPDWIQKALNLSDVMRGQTSKRGESGEAVERKIEMASATLNQLQLDDDIETQKLLYGILVDLTNPKRLRLDTAKELLGPDVPEAHLQVVLRKSMRSMVSSVVLIPGEMHPKTPEKVQDNLIALRGADIIDSDMARYAMDERGISPDIILRGSVRKQDMEIQMMIDGQESVPSIEDVHKHHLWALQRFADSPRFLTLDSAAQDRVHQHYALHYAQLQQEMGQMPSPEPQAQPSPPAAAMEAASGAAGAVGPAVQVA